MSGGDTLDPLLAGVREEVRARAEAGGRVRDFAAMIARAHAIDSTAVPEEAVAEAAQFAPVVALRVVPVVSEDRNEGTGRRRWAGTIAAACALILAAAGVLGAMRLARDESGSPGAHAVPLVGPPRAEAEVSAGTRHTAGTSAGSRPAQASDRGPEGPGGHQETVAEDMSVGAGDGCAGESGGAAGCLQGQEVLDVSQGTRESTAAAGARDGAAAAPRGRGPVNGPRDRSGAGRAEGDAGGAEAKARATGEAAWDAIDRAAREAWRRGDVAEARALLTTLVRADAEPSRVELAYGDLFVLTRRAGDEEALARLWRAYLARFPRGLYAEDARAGLCRRAAGAQRRACWDLYLETWPEGAHAGEAREGL